MSELTLIVQDLVRRFTLDSASEFLFGHNVESLSAGIPYPPYAEHKNLPTFTNHSSNIFSRAFAQGQSFATARIAFADEWSLAEFWKDKILPERKVMDSFTEPLMLEALANRERHLKSAERGDNEDLTLLSHLVRHTQDTDIIKDELINLLVAGRDTVCFTNLLFCCDSPTPLIDCSVVDFLDVHVGRAP
jgi:hypothetical protein